MMDELLDVIDGSYPMKRLDAAEFASIRVSGMRFDVQAFDAVGLGHVSVMKGRGMLGLMRMDTLIINPTRLDLPLYSYDRIIALGNDTFLIELYDTTVAPFASEALDDVLASAKNLPRRDPGVHWYDSLRLPQSLSLKGKRAQSPSFDRVAQEYLRAWLNADAPVPTDPAIKKEKTAAYVEGLLSNGGPSTDVFKKKLGPQSTARLFRQVLFGTEA